MKKLLSILLVLSLMLTASVTTAFAADDLENWAELYGIADGDDGDAILWDIWFDQGTIKNKNYVQSEITFEDVKEDFLTGLISIRSIDVTKLATYEGLLSLIIDIFESNEYEGMSFDYETAVQFAHLYGLDLDFPQTPTDEDKVMTYLIFLYVQLVTSEYPTEVDSLLGELTDDVLDLPAFEMPEIPDGTSLLDAVKILITDTLVQIPLVIDLSNAETLEAVIVKTFSDILSIMPGVGVSPITEDSTYEEALLAAIQLLATISQGEIPANITIDQFFILLQNQILVQYIGTEFPAGASDDELFRLFLGVQCDNWFWESPVDYTDLSAEEIFQLLKDDGYYDDVWDGDGFIASESEYTLTLDENTDTIGFAAFGDENFIASVTANGIDYTGFSDWDSEYMELDIKDIDTITVISKSFSGEVMTYNFEIIRPTGPKKPDVPKTGAQSFPTAFASLFVISAGLFIFLRKKANG